MQATNCMSLHTVGANPSGFVLTIGDTGVALKCELEPALLLMESTAIFVVGASGCVELLEHIALHCSEHS